MGIKKVLQEVGSFAINSAGQMLSDSFIEYFRCDGFPQDALMIPAQQVQRDINKKGKANINGTENYISNGSVFDVSINQCAILIENGKIHDCIIATSPELTGQYQYMSNLEPSFIVPTSPSVGLETQSSPKLKERLGVIWNEYKNRLSAGGQTTNSMQLFYINLRPVNAIKVGAGNIKIRDRNINQTINLGVNGTITLQIINPVMFYEKFISNINEVFSLSSGNGQQLYRTIKNLMVLDIANIMVNVVNNSGATDWWDLETHQGELSSAVVEYIGSKLLEDFGMAVSEVALRAIIDADQQKELEKFDHLKRLGSDRDMMAASMLEAQNQALNTAAGNSAGAINGFMGMGMMNQSISNNGMATLIGNMPAPQQQSVQVVPPVQLPIEPTSQKSNSEGWICECGEKNSMKFCMNCGKAKPTPTVIPSTMAEWNCPECGTSNSYNFCMNCGTKKPELHRELKCPKCGWIPDPDLKDVKFCPVCGSSIQN